MWDVGLASNGFANAVGIADFAGQEGLFLAFAGCKVQAASRPILDDGLAMAPIQACGSDYVVAMVGHVVFLVVDDDSCRPTAMAGKSYAFVNDS